MNNKINNGKGFLKEKLGGYRVDPPEEVWSAIAARLGNRRRRNMIIVTLSAAASLALAITLGIHYLGPGVPEEPEIAGTIEESGPLQEKSVEAADSETGTDETTRQLEEKVRDALKEMAEPSGEEPLARNEPVAAQVESARQQEEPAIEPGQERITGEEAGEEAGEEPAQELDQEPAQDVVMEKEEEQALVEDLALELEEEQQQGLETVLQSEPGEIEQRETRWSVAGVFSPLYSFRDAEADAIAGAADYESGMLAYAGGIEIGYRAGSRLAIESGIYYNKMGIAIGGGGTELFGRSFDFAPLGEEASGSMIKTITNSVGNIVASSGDLYVNNYKLYATGANSYINDNTTVNLASTDEVIRQHLEYLELPLNLRFTFLDRSIKLQFVGGMSANFLVGNYVTMESAEGISEIGYLANIRQVNYSGNAGVGMTLHLLDRLNLRLEPRFRYFLNSINDKTLPSTRPYSMGLYTGLSYRF